MPARYRASRPTNGGEISSDLRIFDVFPQNDSGELPDDVFLRAISDCLWLGIAILSTPLVHFALSAVF